VYYNVDKCLHCFLQPEIKPLCFSDIERMLWAQTEAKNRYIQPLKPEVLILIGTYCDTMGNTVGTEANKHKKRDI
jgi:hypothetical protein